ncbi:MAG: spondin domain-containing protein [Chloroflexi bacterium]|nr:spondin domain-containing protein [Chloroflexota bacterium]
MALAAAAVFALTSIASGDDGDRGGARYKVTITNITRGQILSPAVVATHKSTLDPIFQLGAPASPEFAGLAEDATLAPFAQMLEDSSSVAQVITLTGAGGPILPGETASAMITTRGDADQISLAGMLVTTNDTFVGLSGVDLPRRGSVRYVSAGYDAGTEANNEDCVFIPGPPCGNGGVRDTAGAEGYVYVGNGVHGIADLVPAEHDWHNPAVVITITRVSGGNDD